MYNLQQGGGSLRKFRNQLSFEEPPVRPAGLGRPGGNGPRALPLLGWWWKSPVRHHDRHSNYLILKINYLYCIINVSRVY